MPFNKMPTQTYRLCQRCKIKNKQGKPESAGYAVPSKHWENHMWIVHRMKKID